MENIDLNNILDRYKLENDIIKCLNDTQNTNSKKGIYVYGDDGIGKTKFVKNLLKKYNYDIIYYDNTNLRNKNLIDNISNNNIASKNVFTLLNNVPKKLVLVLDDLYSMNYGDKTSLTLLNKILKNKKTKKTKSENFYTNPIICINNDNQEKKILDIIKVSNVFKIENPTDNQLLEILDKLLPNLFRYTNSINEIVKKNILLYLNNKLVKIKNVLYFEKNDLILIKFYDNYINTDCDRFLNVKLLTHNLLTKYYGFKNINKIIESDRTIISLLFHENIIINFENKLTKENLKYYINILNNFTYCDYIDRTIFQKQIWQLNDICYLVKIFYNNYLLKEYNFLNNNIQNEKIIFTKILTKYSSEYNNYIFLYNICQDLNLTKSNLYTYIYYIYTTYSIEEIYTKLESLNITKLVFNRIIKLILNNINYVYSNTTLLKNDLMIENSFYDSDDD